MKGQYFSFDALMGAFMYIIALITFFSFWYYVSTQSTTNMDMLRKEAIRISYLLLSSSSNYSIINDPLSFTYDTTTKEKAREKIESLDATTPYCLKVVYFNPSNNNEGEIYDGCANHEIYYTLYRGINVRKGSYTFGTILKISLGKPSK